ncbi:hypothetical protein ACFP3I_16070 [Chryseobacterium arachidis]
MPFSCAYYLIVMGHIKLPVSYPEVLIIKNLPIKGKEKKHSK